MVKRPVKRSMPDMPEGYGDDSGDVYDPVVELRAAEARVLSAQEGVSRTSESARSSLFREPGEARAALDESERVLRMALAELKEARRKASET